MKSKDIQLRKLLAGASVMLSGILCFCALPSHADKNWTYEPAVKAAEQNKAEAVELESLTANYKGAVKEQGENSQAAAGEARKLAQYYIEHRQFGEARPVCLKLVEFCRYPKNYYDLGAEWDERRKRGVPTESMEKMMINGKEEMIAVIDNRRPSAKLNRADLVRSLYVLSKIDKNLGKEKQASAELEEAKQNYLKYQFEKPALALTSFQAFIDKYAHGNIVGSPQLKNLLAMDYGE